MNRDLEVFQTNVRRLRDMVAGIGLPPSECGLGAPKVFEIEGGILRIWILFERESVTIAKAHMTEGSTFPLHMHDSQETVVLYEGEAFYSSLDEPERRLLPGESITVDATKPHRMRAGPDGAWFSVTTVPREEDFGDAAR